MNVISATEAKNRLASVMDAAAREPVIIQKNGKPFVVMMSVENYEHIVEWERKEAFVALCNKLASTAKKNGMTEALLQSLLASD